MAYIIGTYNRFDSWHRQHQRHQFEINGQWYAIFEIEMDWGLPKLPERIDSHDCAQTYHIYDTYQDAMQFVNRVKQMNI